MTERWEISWFQHTVWYNIHTGPEKPPDDVTGSPHRVTLGKGRCHALNCVHPSTFIYGGVWNRPLKRWLRLKGAKGRILVRAQWPPKKRKISTLAQYTQWKAIQAHRKNVVIKPGRGSSLESYCADTLMLDIQLSKYDKINVHLSHPCVTVGEELEASGQYSHPAKIFS